MPIPRLEERLRALEAAMPVCRAEPTRRAVHTLRAAIRSVEAALAVLPDLPGMPSVAHAGRDLLRVTARLRRRAGRIRDLDVFLSLLHGHEAELALDADDIGKVRRDCKELRRVCRRRRKRTADRLVRSLERYEHRGRGCGGGGADHLQALRRHRRPPSRRWFVSLRAGSARCPRFVPRSLAMRTTTRSGRRPSRPAWPPNWARGWRQPMRPPGAFMRCSRPAASGTTGWSSPSWPPAGSDVIAETTVAMMSRSERSLRLFEELIAPFRPKARSGKSTKQR